MDQELEAAKQPGLKVKPKAGRNRGPMGTQVILIITQVIVEQELSKHLF